MRMNGLAKMYFIDELKTFKHCMTDIGVVLARIT